MALGVGQIALKKRRASNLPMLTPKNRIFREWLKDQQIQSVTIGISTRIINYIIFDTLVHF